MNEQPVQDKTVIAVGTLTSTLIGLQWFEAGLALVIAVMTATLLGMRIWLAWRDIRREPPAGN